MSDKIVIAIDGPAGAGKSTVAKLVATNLGYSYIDTGAMYRAIALKAVTLGVDNDTEAIEKMAENIDISFKYDQGLNRIYLDGKEVTNEIRTPEISNKASFVSSLKGVREAMLIKQRNLGIKGNVVMDGRDVGTCIFPDAKVKVFLIASSIERARRRYIELVAKGDSVELEELQKEIDARDKADSERAIAPLKKADDALELDSTKLSIKETVDRIIEYTMQKVK